MWRYIIIRNPPASQLCIGVLTVLLLYNFIGSHITAHRHDGPDLHIDSASILRSYIYIYTTFYSHRQVSQYGYKKQSTH